jgi:HEPN domain-containing protein
MPSAGANLWISQANSDRLAAARVYDPTGVRTWCQAVAKHQQVVEKSIKAIAAARQAAGMGGLPIKYYYRHRVDEIISELRRTAGRQARKAIQGRINKLLDQFHRAEIRALSDLAPQKPASGALHARNTEYPYETAAGVWTAPGLEGGFTTHDVDRFATLSERINQGSREIVSALRR